MSTLYFKNTTSKKKNKEWLGFPRDKSLFLIHFERSFLSQFDNISTADVRVNYSSVKHMPILKYAQARTFRHLANEHNF